MNTEVHTRDGQVHGTFSDGVYTFKGLPFAAPPVGAIHLQAPQPVEPWSGVRDALTFGPEPFQSRRPAEMT